MADAELVTITLRTLRVGFESTAIATLLGVPAGCLLGLGRFRGRTLLLGTANAGIRTPPVALGVLLWLLLWPDSRWGGGLLSGLGWIYTMSAVILAQTLLVLPIVVALTAAAVQRVPDDLLDQARAFGAPAWRCATLALREARVGVLAALIAALGTAIAAVGAILVVGSTISSETLATATLAHWNAGGEDAQAVACGTLLLGMFVVLSAVLTTMQHRRSGWIPGRAS